MKGTKFKTQTRTAAAVIAVVLLAACGRYDDIDNLKDRVATLEEAAAALKTRLDAGSFIKSITPIGEAPGGWRIEFTGGNPSSIDVMNGASSAPGADGITPQIEVRNGADGKVTIWYKTDGDWTDTGVNIAAVSPRVRVVDNKNGTVTIEYNSTAGYPPSGWIAAGAPIALNPNPGKPNDNGNGGTSPSPNPGPGSNDKGSIYSIVKNEATGTITITMNDSERTAYEFAMASGAARIELAGFGDMVELVEGESARIRFRVNPSNAWVPLTLDKWSLDQTGTRASYVTAPTDFELASVAKDGDREGQYVATIRFLDYDPAIAAYAMALVLDTGTAAESVLISSPTFVLGGVHVTGVSLDRSWFMLSVGKSETLTATIAPAEAANKAVSWAVTKGKDFATVDQDGNVTAVKTGTATVTATTADGGKIATSTVVIVPMEVCLIPHGTFLMGSPESEPGRMENETQHEVTLTKDFYMGKYEITNAQYAEFLQAKGITHYDSTPLLPGIDLMYNGAEGIWWTLHPNHPVTVSWHGAKAYAEWVGGALPTEAQWEYACRGGQTESLPFGIGDGTELWADMGRFVGDYPYRLSSGGTIEKYDGSDGHPNSSSPYAGLFDVGSFSYTNGYGLYDMHGNVPEWCFDSWNSGTYDPAPVTDPVGICTMSGSTNIIRGGGERTYAVMCRSAHRLGNSPTERSTCGIRVIFPVPEP